MLDDLVVVVVDHDERWRARIALEISRSVSGGRTLQVADIADLRAALSSVLPAALILREGSAGPELTAIMAELARRGVQVAVVVVTQLGREPAPGRNTPTGPVTTCSEEDIGAVVAATLGTGDRSGFHAGGDVSHLERLLDSLDVAVYRTGQDGTLADVNAAFLRMLRFRSPSDVAGTRLVDLVVNPDERARLELAAANFEVIPRLEVELRRHDGTRLWAVLSETASGSHHGTRSGLLRDVTEARHTERALLASEERLRHLVESARVIPWEFDIATDRFTWVGNQAVALLAYPLTAWYAPGFWQAHVIPQDRTRAIESCRRITADVDEYSSEYRMVAADGRTVWFHDTGAVRFEGDQPRRLSGFLIDVTDRKNAELRLAESERRFREMLSNVRLVAVALDRQGQIVFCNRFLLELAGYLQEEVHGRSWFELFLPADHRDWVRAMFDRNIENGSIPVHVENEIVGRDGSHRLISWNNTILRDPSGRVIGTASIGEDITERRAAEERDRLALALALAGETADEFGLILEEIAATASDCLGRGDVESDIATALQLIAQRARRGLARRRVIADRRESGGAASGAPPPASANTPP